MAKINTLNYQTVASWNGSQDLFVVEQLDGTKVATPEQIKQYVLGDMDEVPTQNSNNPVKSGGIFSTMAVPKYDATNRREYFEGGAAFDGNIDSTPTAGSNNAVASGGTKTYVDGLIAEIAPSVTKLAGLIDFVHDLPPDASTTPSKIPTGIRVHFNVSTQRAGYPMGNVLYVSIKIEDTRCVQILFECNTGNPIMLRTSLTASTWSNWTTISQS